ncbi:MAG TPA: hypothetical protein VJN39_00415 [Gemmatimonadales bacterium]|nr:hypothetical protein [Gemmatimonadales bacterium]
MAFRFTRPTVFRSALAGAFAWTVWQACSDVIGPDNRKAIRVAVGDTVSGQIGLSSDTLVYVFETPADVYYAVFFQQAPTNAPGAFELRVGYTGFTTPLGRVVSRPGLPLLKDGTEAFHAHVASKMEIFVDKLFLREGSFKFLIQRVNPSPESVSPRMNEGDTVKSEILETIADLDQFTFAGQAGQTVVLTLQAEGPANSGIIRAVLDSVAGFRLGVVRSAGGDSTLDGQTSGLIVLPATRDYRLTVSSQRDDVSKHNYDGPYRLAVVPWSSGPEVGSSTIAIGDTVRERISPIGDIDEFHFTGAAGQLLNVFFQAMSGDSKDELLLTVNGLVVASVGTDTSMSDHATGRFALPTSGTYTVRVSGVSPDSAGDRGPYRFQVYPIDRRPERAPPTLTLGDSVAESIDVLGDIDEYTLTVPESGLANIFTWRDPAGSPSNGPLAELDAEFCEGAPPGSPLVLSTGTFPIASGTHRLNVCANGGSSGYKGPYRVHTYVISSRPEHTRDTLVLGDTVTGESLDVPGDWDNFVFYARKGQHVVAQLQGLGVAGNGYFALSIQPPDGSIQLRGLVIPTASSSLDSTRTSRLDIAADGWYRVSIYPGQQGHSITEVGPYRFAILPFDARPETAARQVALGDSVGSERIDYPDDMDEFVLTGTPGAEFAVFAQDGMRLVVYDTTTQDSLPREDIGLLALPPTGVVGLRVTGPIGPYWFKVVPVKRAPETVPAVYTVGDTVRGEAIFPGGDIDEFTSSGTPGEQLTLYDRLTVTSSVDSAIVLEAIDPAPGTSLVGSNTAVFGSSFYPVGSFTVPASGRFIIRARIYGYGLGTTSYEFFVKRGP